ncbi:MAG TPA: nucleoside deaminase [Clostridiaceae bacterium]|nr:nucleoside deaminase [Clostridiaceae bacterium]
MGPQGKRSIKDEFYFMNEAYKEAIKAYKKGEVPIGAVIVKDGIIISRAHNEREIKHDATLHAEMTCIRKACKKLNSWRLNDCDIYTTLEPCPMCAGALIQARINRLYIGAKDPKGGAVGSVIDVLGENLFNHKVEIVYGIMEEQCSAILKDFFKNLRTKN